MHLGKGAGVATKKAIRIDEEAYDRLRAARKEGESFSQVIKRVVRKPPDARRLLEEIGEQAISREASEAIESHIRHRHRQSAGGR